MEPHLRYRLIKYAPSYGDSLIMLSVCCKGSILFPAFAGPPFFARDAAAFLRPSHPAAAVFVLLPVCYSAYFIRPVTISSNLHFIALRSIRPKFSPVPINALLSHQQQVIPRARAAAM